MITLSILYNAAPSFVFDPALIEISGALARLKDIKPANATFYAGFHINENAEYGNGVLICTLNGGAAIVAGWLDLTGGAGKWADYDAVLNADSQQVGCIRFKYKPNYSGPSDKCLISINEIGGTGLANLIQIIQSSDGNIYWEIKDSSSNPIIVLSPLGAWSPVAETEYEFEMNYDITTGATRLFIDGVQLGATDTSTGTRTGVGILRLGIAWNLTGISDGSFREVIFFNVVKHTANFASELPRLDQTQYSIYKPSIVMASGQNLKNLSSFAESVTKPATTDIKYVLVVDSIEKFWNGSAWAVSSGAAQSNTAAEILANVTTLGTGSGVSLKIKAYLISTNGNVRPVITSNTIIYDFFAGIPASLPTCVVYGWLKDVAGVAKNGVQVEARLITQESYASVPATVMGLTAKTATTNAAGYWEIPLVDTVTMGVGVKYQFTFTYSPDYIAIANKAVPAAASALYNTLT